MSPFGWKKLFFITLFALCSTKSVSAVDGEGPLDFLETKYKSLSPKGKFAAGAAVGFVGSRIAVNTAMTAVKIGAAAFITAEVLHYTGVLDDLPSLSEEQSDALKSLKGTVIRKTQAFRKDVRRRLSKDSIQWVFDNERVGALGLASGAFVGTMI